MNIKKITRNMAALITVCALTLQCTTGFAAAYLRGHGYGEAYKSVTTDDCIALSDAQIISGGVKINAGGSATFGFYVPYGVSAVTLVYKDSVGAVSVDMGERTYSVEELSGTINEETGLYEYYLNFGDNLGIPDYYFDYNNAQQMGYYRDFLEHRGEYEVVLTSEGGITLTELKFERELVPATPEREMMDISSEARQMLSTVLMDIDSPVIVVNGATRYVDVNKPDTVPYSYKGRLYLPINTLAKALGYYHEDYPDKGYALMRGDQSEVVLLEGRCTLTQGVKDPIDVDNEAIIYKDGKAWGAVRYFATLAGDTVAYKDGLVVIDNKYTVDKVMNDEVLHNYALSFFEPYNTKKEKGSTYYVSQNDANASDYNNGSKDKPFKTIGKAAKIARAGDTVIVCEGVYREELVPRYDGTAASPITFKAKEGDRVVLSANEVLGTWTKEGNSNIWKTPMDWNLGTTRNQIFIDEKSLNEARYPNGPEILNNTDVVDNMWPVRGDLWRPANKSDEEGNVIEDNTNIVRSSSLLWQDEPDYWKGGIYVGLFGYMYSYMTAKIASSKYGELTLEANEKSGPWYTNTKSLDHGYIVGHKNCLDIPGEWIYEDGYLYMIFPDGKTPNETVVEAKKRQRVIDLNDRRYINVIGFETIGGSVRTDDAEMCMLNGLNMKYISHYIHLAHSYKGNTDFPYDPMDPKASSERGENGIYLSGTNDIFVNCTIDHSAGAGLYMTGLYSYVENNIIKDCGYNCTQNSGLYIAGRAYEDFGKPRGGHSIYNNTVYNTGRSAMQVSSADRTKYSYLPFLPFETAYNDFHGANLDSTDTGVTYEYTVQMELDGHDSTLHHNYIYVDERIAQNDTPYQYCLVYHDEGSRGYTTYDNQLFTSDAGFVPTMGFSYQNRGGKGDNLAEGTNNSSEAYSRMWNNSEHVVPGGVDNLHEGYFSEERPFYAGAMRDYRTLEDIDYTRNYDRYKAGIFNMPYRAMDAKLSDGVIIDEKTGYAKLSGDNQYVHFEDVVFPDKTETIAISLHGSSHNTGDIIDVIIGDSIEDGVVYTKKFVANSLDTSDVDRLAYIIDDTSGIHDVWVRVSSYKSVEIGGIGAYAIVDPVESDPAYSSFVWGGEFTSKGTTSTPAASVASIYLNGDGYNRKILSRAYAGNYVKYENVTLTQNSDEFTALMRSSNSEGQRVDVYVESPDSVKFTSEPLLTFNVESKGWTDTVKQYLPLTEELKAGTYDIYISFPVVGETAEEIKAYRSKLCTLINWGFKTSGSVLEEYKDARVKINAGKFNAELSHQSTSYPFRMAKLESHPDMDILGLTYTLPGTVAGYADVSFKQPATKLVVRYSAEDYLAGQTVEVRVGNPDSDPVASFVTESTGGYRNLETKRITLNETIPSGTYDVYFTFTDDTSGEVKTCNLSWFGFN